MSKTLSAWLVLATVCLMTAPAQTAEPVRLIFDTDICGDCDDVLALGMIHALESRGTCKLLAVTISVDHERAGPFVDAVNTFYGRPHIPIGAVGKGGVVEKSRYLSLVDAKDGDRSRFPHNLVSGRSAPSATAVLRKTLAAQPDRSVVIAQVGFSTNLARLLNSPADEYSPLTGRDLVQKKVKLLSLMAGAFQTIDGNRRYLEYNVVKDVASARHWRSDGPRPWFTVGSRSGSHCPIQRSASSATTVM